MSAVAVGIDVSQWPVIGRERVLVQHNASHNRLAGKASDMAQEIAGAVRHTYSGVYLLSSLMTWTTDQLLAALYMAVAVMLIVALYHVILILVDVRKIMKRAERITSQVEQVAMKPLEMVDTGIEWVAAHLEGKRRK